MVITEQLLANIAAINPKINLKIRQSSGGNTDEGVMTAATRRLVATKTRAQALATRLRTHRSRAQLLGTGTSLVDPALEKDARDTATFLASADATAVMRGNASVIPPGWRQPESWSRGAVCTEARASKTKPEVGARWHGCICVSWWQVLCALVGRRGAARWRMEQFPSHKHADHCLHLRPDPALAKL